MKFILRSLLILHWLFMVWFLRWETCSSCTSTPQSGGRLASPSAWSALRYLVGPWFIEWLLTIVWDDGNTLLPEANREFVAKLYCRTRHQSSAHGRNLQRHARHPFSFGHTPSMRASSSRRGLLDVLTPEETNACSHT